MGKAAAVAFLAASACGAVLAVFACIPDLPAGDSAVAEASVDAPTVDVQAEAGPPPSPPRCRDGIIQLDRGEQCDPGGNLPADAAPDVTYLGCNSSCQFVCPGFLWPMNNHCYTVDSRMASAIDQQ